MEEGGLADDDSSTHLDWSMELTAAIVLTLV
jgi:hypothetical protein